MELRTGKSIWEDMPEDWNPGIKESEKDEKNIDSSEDNMVHEPSFGTPPTEETQEEPTNETGEEAQKEIKEEPQKEIKEEPQKEIKEDSQKESTAEGDSGSKKDSTKTTKRKKKKEKKLEKLKIAAFEKESKENKYNSSEHAKDAYDEEKKANRSDFIILGIGITIIIIGIIIFVVAFTKTSTQHVYDLINQGNYSTAYQEIEELYEEDKNVDSLVYDFAESCVQNSEYKRAIASLEFLSGDAETNKEFFDTIIDGMLTHQKVNRANEVLDYMRSHGDTLTQYADELYNKYKDRFTGEE